MISTKILYSTIVLWKLKVFHWYSRPITSQNLIPNNYSNEWRISTIGKVKHIWKFLIFICNLISKDIRTKLFFIVNIEMQNKTSNHIDFFPFLMKHICFFHTHLFLMKILKSYLVNIKNVLYKEQNIKYLSKCWFSTVIGKQYKLNMNLHLYPSV